MNVTFLIGNGFDLHLGLKTRYSQFLHWYVETSSADLDIFAFKEGLKAESSSGLWWSDAEIAMGAMFGEYTDENIEKYYKCIRDFKQQLVVYLHSEQERCDYSNRTEIAKKFRYFLQTYQSEIMLNQSAEYFQRKNENAFFFFINFNYTDTLMNIIQCCGGPRGVIGNYEYAGGSYLDSIREVIPIHGDLSSSIIMGVNDESQIRNNEGVLSPKAQRTLIKPAVNKALNRSEDTRAEKAIANSDSIVLYGLSIGETDQKWWNLLREWMLRSATHRIVLFARSNQDDFDPTIPEDLLDYVEGQKESLLSKFKVSKDHKSYEQLKQQIFIIRNTKKLNFDIVKDKEPAGALS